MNPLLSQMNSFRALIPYVLMIHFNITSLLRLAVASGLSLSIFQLTFLSIPHLYHACYVSHAAHHHRSDNIW